MIFLREKTFKTFLLEGAIALLAVFLLKGGGGDVRLFNGPRLFYFMSREERRERQKVCRYRYRIFPGYFASLSPPKKLHMFAKNILHFAS